MKWSKEFQEEFKDNIKKVAKEYGYEISDNELQLLYDSYFHKDVGILGHMIHSKVQDFMFLKEKEKSKEQENNNSKEF